MSALCLYCPSIPLELLPETNEQIAFYRCPRCQREFAQCPGQSLTTRWRGALSLVLYGVIFSQHPQERAIPLADMLCNQKSIQELQWIVDEIRLELATPTHQVKDTLDLVASEEDLRDFLASVADRISTRLQR